MTLFESTLALLLVAVILLQFSRRLGTPYPSMLALAGVCVAALPWAPQLAIEPRVSLALFIAPVLLDAAYDTAPRQLARNWVPLFSLVVFAVVLTTAAVAWAAWGLLGLPVAAAITLGAIVAPPDAAAATAVLSQFSLPRRTITIVQGESLLNDAIALLIFGAASSAALAGHVGDRFSLFLFLVAIPGGVIVGILIAKAYMRLAPLVAGTLSSSITQFGTTYGVWIIADRLHLSPILCVVAYGMTIARYAPARMGARDRIHSFSVWQAVVFILNVLAFLLMGLQARNILSRLGGSWPRALAFPLLVLALVIVTRVVWVLIHGTITMLLRKRRGLPSYPWGSLALVSWCGMRGLVTLATAFALPAHFPARDEIVLSSFTVVLGTLVLQGLTLKPLINLLHIQSDGEWNEELSRARVRMLDAAVRSLRQNPSEVAGIVRTEYESTKVEALKTESPLEKSEHDHLRMQAIRAQREVLLQLRNDGEIDEDTFQRLEEELDWSELAAASPGHFQLLGT